MYYEERDTTISAQHSDESVPQMKNNRVSHRLSDMFDINVGTKPYLSWLTHMKKKKHLSKKQQL